MTYDVEALRAQFPILSKEVYGKPLVYLDNAASAQKPRAVIDAMVDTMTGGYSNVHRGLHYMANAATEAFEGGRESVRAFLNAASVDEIVFTRSATAAINLVADSFGRMAIGEGDEIILSIMEHHSNIVPWHFLRERKGAVIKWVPVDDEGNFLVEEFEKLISPRTKIVAMTHMSNMLGTVTPIADVIRIAHAHGVPVMVDGSQGAVHLDVDVQALDADFYVFTGHKVYGPTGIGVLYGKSEWLRKMPPYEGGGEMIKVVSEDTVTYGDPPHRFEAGTPPIIEAIGLGAALRFMESVGRPAIRAHEDALSAYAHERLGRMNSIRIFGRARGKGPILSFEMKGAHAHDVATVIDRQGVAVRAGTHCAMPLLDRFGVTSTCRASFGLYNTMAEVDKLAEALSKAESLFSLILTSFADDRHSPTDEAAKAANGAAAVNGAADAIGAAAVAPTTSALPPEEIDRLTDDIVAALKTVYDPEIPSDIYELGLIYRVDIADDRTVSIDMTLTAPACPVAGEMPIWVETAVAAVPGVKEAKVNMVFDPPWDQSRMSDEARIALDMW